MTKTYLLAKNIQGVAVATCIAIASETRYRTMKLLHFPTLFALGALGTASSFTVLSSRSHRILHEQLRLAAAAANDDFITTDSGIRYNIVKEGRDGPGPNTGQTINAHYTGWLDDFDGTDKFDSTRDDGRLFQFEVGKGQVIQGWDETFGEMKIGERRQIILPPQMAYGDEGVPGIIPKGATLFFDLELVEAL